MKNGTNVSGIDGDDDSDGDIYSDGGWSCSFIPIFVIMTFSTSLKVDIAI